MKAKEIQVSKWLNISGDFNLKLDDGKIKLIHVFQMLCPGCVYYGIPQTTELFNKYASDNFQVLALHSVFENHEVMNEEALKVFIHEWKLPFPVGIDKSIEGDWMPATMKAYQLQGTPSTLIIDGRGELLVSHFGHFELPKLEAYLDKLIQQSR